jgi:hypothetical protein
LSAAQCEPETKEAPKMNTKLTPVISRRTAFGIPAAGRWHTADGIEVCEGPDWHGRAPERRFVAQRRTGGRCAWGATAEAAAEAVRAAG